MINIQFFFQLSRQEKYNHTRSARKALCNSINENNKKKRQRMFVQKLFGKDQVCFINRVA